MAVTRVGGDAGEADVAPARRATVGRPTTSTPTRRRGSVRRTTTHDSTRREGLDGPITLVAQGRDLVTRSDGTTVEIDVAQIEVSASPTMRGQVTGIVSHPRDTRLLGLVGVSPYAGFRKALLGLVPEEQLSGSVRFQLFDDLPTALMLSGRALRAAGRGLGEPISGPPSNIDVCAGWADGGTAVLGYGDSGPPLFIGPVAPEVEDPDDRIGWHEHAELPGHGTRRRRRLDVWREGDQAMVDCFFRDSHMDERGVETIVHEYTVRASLDVATTTFSSAEVDFGALPFPECPGALRSVERLSSMSARGLRGMVRKNFTGTSTCSHLNDQLRSFEDVVPLLRALDDHPAGSST